MDDSALQTDSAPAPTCIVCGYDLRAQSAEGKCPECGADVERSLHGHWLRYADQRWARAVSRGLIWTWRGVATVLIGVIAMPVFVVVVAGAQGTSVGPLPAWFERIFSIIVFTAWLAGASALAAGLWLLTVPEPSSVATDPLRPRLLRWLTVAVLPVIFGWVAFDTALAFSAGLPAWAGPILTFLAAAVVGLQAWLLVGHLRTLERRCIGMDAQREKVLHRYSRQVAGVSISVLILTVGMYVIVGYTIGAGIILIAWVAVLGLTRETSRRVRLELAMPTDAQAHPKAE